MRSIHMALLLALSCPTAKATFLDCVFFDGVDGDSAAVPAAWKGNLRTHNCARKTVVPAAAPGLPLLRWSSAIAQTAQAYADRCIWQHSGAAGLGENLYATAPFGSAQTAAAISWGGEFAHYNYAANSCAAGQTCGHYTQMVWRDSDELGCGISNCSSGSPFGASFPHWTIVVCNYLPPGNFGGERPY